MYVTVAIGTFLLGGWLIDSPPESEESLATPQTQEQTQQTPAPMLVPPVPRDQIRAGEGRRYDRNDHTSANARTSAQPQQPQNAPNAQGILPTAPTESPSDAEAMTNRPTAPTSGFPNPNLQQQPSMMAPTESRNMSSFGGYRPHSYSSLGNRQSTTQSMPSGTAAFMTPPSAAISQATTAQEKAFSGYRPTSGVSPYMNLFRRDNSGTVDNYSTLVRPATEQRFLNQRFGTDIHGLQNSTRTQGMNLQHLNQQNRTLQGVGTPQYYMNYGNYYPGYGQ